MSARTCLLCGKPLSRIWSGSSEDFCSREHRNQYRLRRGMDRLLESTRVSNVMRRRELPMPVAQPVAPTGGGMPRIADSGGIRILARPAAPAFPPNRARLAARMPEGGNWATDRQAFAGAAKPREFRMVRHRPLRQVPMARKQRIASEGPAMANPAERSVAYAPPARKGRALRVSMGAGFRVPKPQKHQYEARKLPPVALTLDAHGAGLICQSLIRENPAIQKSFGIVISQLPELPVRRRREIALNFKWPGPMDVSAARVDGSTSRRELAMPLGRSEQPPATGIFRPQVSGAGLAASFVRTRLQPVSVPASIRIATVPFDSQYLTASTVQEHPY